MTTCGSVGGRSIADSARDTLRYLTTTPERERVAMGRRARRRVLAEHTAEHRAVELEQHLVDLRQPRLVRAYPKLELATQL